MELHIDFRDLLASFLKHEVEFLVVGGYALAAYGVPRATGDLDLFVLPTAENARRIVNALADFGFGSLGITEADLSKPDQVVQLGYPPVRVDPAVVQPAVERAILEVLPEVVEVVLRQALATSPGFRDLVEAAVDEAVRAQLAPIARSVVRERLAELEAASDEQS